MCKKICSSKLTHGWTAIAAKFATLARTSADGSKALQLLIGWTLGVDWQSRPPREQLSRSSKQA